MDTDLVQKIEVQRLELESNIAKLRKSLHHWTTLELDYEGLKDEFCMLGASATKTDCLKAALDFGPQKVDEKELNDLIEPSYGKTRSPVQIIDLLSKRIDYVLRNAESLKKQISELEKKRNAALLAAHPEHEAEATLPIAEITEELDDDGNVVSSNVQKQGDTAKKVLDVLQKTKVEPIDVPLTRDSPSASSSRIEEIDSSDDDTISTEVETVVDDTSMNFKAIPNRVDRHALPTTAEFPTNPNDTEEEAELRQEMINYGLNEVGNIVAELELGDAEIEHSEDEDEEMENDVDEDGDDDFTDGDSEDESGRSRALYTEKYRNRMEELQRQLGLKMENVGPLPEAASDHGVKEEIELVPDSQFKEHLDHLPPEFRKRFSRPSAAEAARKAAIARAEANRNTIGDSDETGEKVTKKTAKKRKVAFAPTVEIAPDPPSTTPTVMSNTITEHPKIDALPTEPSPPKSGVSRFKATRSSQPQTPLYPPPMELQPKKDEPTGPAGKTIAQTLVERPGTLSAKDAPPPDGDDFDEELQKRQIALEHHRLRNRMVHEQGGYVKGGEAENWGDAYAAPEIEDSKTGQPVKISRFKAARLKP